MTTVLTTGGLTQEEEAQLVALLGKVGQPWSPAFYNALAPMVRMPTTDLVLVDNRGRVFMTQRPADDAFEPGWWHFTGTLVRKTDLRNTDALRRIGVRELGLSVGELLGLILRSEFLCEGFNESRRGPEVNRYYWAVLNEELALQLESKGVGRFVSYDEFKTLTVLQHHVEIDIWNRF